MFSGQKLQYYSFVLLIENTHHIYNVFTVIRTIYYSVNVIQMRERERERERTPFLDSPSSMEG